MCKNINYEKLRKDLEDYYGTAMSSGFPMAMMELSKLKNVTDKEIEKMAKKEGLDLLKYEL